jgi:AcrR family transcriptional regulator
VTDKEKRKIDILEYACRVFRERGYHNARMAQIAEAAGVSYGLVYHYHKSKENLFDAILEKWWGGLNEMMDNGLDAHEHVADQLAVIINYFLDQYESNPDLVHIFITEVSRSSANLTPARLDMFKHWIGRTESLIAAAQKRGELRDNIKARYLSTFFLGALETMLSTLVLNNQPLRGAAQKKRIATNLLEQFFNGALPPKGK